MRKIRSNFDTERNHSWVGSPTWRVDHRHQDADATTKVNQTHAHTPTQSHIMYINIISYTVLIISFCLEKFEEFKGSPSQQGNIGTCIFTVTKVPAVKTYRITKRTLGPKPQLLFDLKIAYIYAMKWKLFMPPLGISCLFLSSDFHEQKLMSWQYGKETEKEWTQCSTLNK